MQTQALVRCEWLNENIEDEGIVILDASFFLPNQQRNAKLEYGQAHIPGARFFDIDEVADHSQNLPHMLPSPEQFKEAVGKLGIDNHKHVIVYDSNFFMASARLWWTFRIFGHNRVSILNGGLNRWKALNYPLSDIVPSPAPLAFEAEFHPELVYDLDQMKAALNQTSPQIIDARSPGRFAGTEPEPRAGLRSGHIPGSYHLFFKDLIDDATHCLKPAQELAALFRMAGIKSHEATVASCGTGVTAAILALGLYELGNQSVAVYDGSWTEWGGREDTPVESEV